MKGHRVVYRAEREDGAGPFQGDLPIEVDGFSDTDGRGPLVCYPEFRRAARDARLDPDLDDRILFGCPDLESLRFWFFPAALDYLRREGRALARSWVLVVYEVPEDRVVVHENSRQAVFDPRVARPLARMALDRLHADRAQWELPL